MGQEKNGKSYNPVLFRHIESAHTEKIIISILYIKKNIHIKCIQLERFGGMEVGNGDV